MAATSSEIAQALVVACLNQPQFVTGNLIPRNTTSGNAELIGEKVGEFYQAIYKAVLEAHSKAMETSKS